MLENIADGRIDGAALRHATGLLIAAGSVAERACRILNGLITLLNIGRHARYASMTCASSVCHVFQFPKPFDLSTLPDGSSLDGKRRQRHKLITIFNYQRFTIAIID